MQIGRDAQIVDAWVVSARLAPFMWWTGLGWTSASPISGSLRWPEGLLRHWVVFHHRPDLCSTTRAGLRWQRLAHLPVIDIRQSSSSSRVLGREVPDDSHQLPRFWHTASKPHLTALLHRHCSLPHIIRVAQSR
jgi:hypothetical protein